MGDKSRLIWVDNAKAIAIITVIMVHIGFGKYANAIMNTFNMPLFFILSGVFLLNHIKETSINQFMIKRTRQLLIPYIFYSVLLVVFYQIILLFTNALPEEIKDFNYIKSIFNILYENVGRDLLPSYYWFFPCLFFSNLIIWLLYKFQIKTRNVFVIISFISIMSLIKNYLSSTPLPLKFDVSLVCTIYVFLGTIFNNNFFYKKNAIVLIIIYLISFHLNYHLMHNGRVELYDGQYGNYILFYISTLSASFLIIYICKKTKIMYLSYIGNRTLAIYCLHFIPLFIIKHYIDTYCQNSPYLILFKISGVIIIMISVLIVEPFIKRFLPWTIGYQKSKK